MKRPPAILAAVLGPLLLVGLGFTVLNPDPRLQIILDVSGSMAGDAGGQEKIEAAKDAILATIDALEQGTLTPGESERPYFLTALRLYGHSLPREPKEASCEDTELVIPFQPLDRGRFLEVLEGAEPSGQTPIARSLREAAADFGEIGEDPAVIILVSDGEETCGGDPAAVACDLKARGFDLTVHTVGFDVDAAARGQLEGVAECTGGEYRDAGDADELGESLRELTTASLVLDKEQTTVGEPVRGGGSFDDAVPLEPGRYHLDHHQRAGEDDFFFLDLTSGQKLRATITSYETGVEISDDEVREGTFAGFSCAGLAVYGPDRSEIGSADNLLTPGRSGTVTVPLSAGEGGRYYLLIGPPPRCDQHMNSPFEVEISDLSDAETDRDAGADYSGAIEIGPGEYEAYLHRNDGVDFYSFVLHDGVTYSLRTRPSEASKTLEFELTDEDGVSLENATAPNAGAAVRLSGIEGETGARRFLKVAEATWDEPPALRDETESAYSLELTAEGAAGAAEEGIAEPEEVEASDADGGDGVSPAVILLSLLVLGAALLGGIVVGRRTS